MDLDCCDKDQISHVAFYLTDAIEVAKFKRWNEVINEVAIIRLERITDRFIKEKNMVDNEKLDENTYCRICSIVAELFRPAIVEVGCLNISKLGKIILEMDPSILSNKMLLQSICLRAVYTDIPFMCRKSNAVIKILLPNICPLLEINESNEKQFLVPYLNVIKYKIGLVLGRLDERIGEYGPKASELPYIKKNSEWNHFSSCLLTLVRQFMSTNKSFLEYVSNKRPKLIIDNYWDKINRQNRNELVKEKESSLPIKAPSANCSIFITIARAVLEDKNFRILQKCGVFPYHPDCYDKCRKIIENS